MSIQAKSYDGTIHSFPDGTPSNVIDNAMRTYKVESQYEKSTSFIPGEPGFWNGVAYGGLQTLDRIAEAAARGVGDVAHAAGAPASFTPGADVAAITAPDEQHMHEIWGGSPGFNVGVGAGDVLASLAPAGDVAKAQQVVGAIPGAAKLGGVLSQVPSDVARFANWTAPTVLPAAAASAVTAKQQGYAPAMQAAKQGAIAAPLAGAGAAGVSALARPVAAVSQHVIDMFAPGWQKAIKDVKNDLKTYGMSPSQVDAAVQELGKDAVPADLERLQSRAKEITSKPGLVSENVVKFLRSRQGAATQRSIQAVQELTGQKGQVWTEAQALKAERKAQASPQFQAAMQGGSLAPLKEQLQKQNWAAGKAVADLDEQISRANYRVTQAAAKLTETRGDVYAESQARREAQEAKNTQISLLDKKRQAVAHHNAVKQAMVEAQADASSGKRGAIWSPAIDQFMSHQWTKKGLAEGLNQEKARAIEEGRTFDPTEYGVTQDRQGNPVLGPDGTPVVGKFPNMNLLHAAKQGVDSFIKANTNIDGSLTPSGAAAKGMLNKFLEDVDARNPEYGKARATFKSYSSKLEWQDKGKDFLKTDPSQIQAMLAKASPEQKAAYLNGVAGNLMAKINGVPSANLDVKTMLDVPGVMERLEAAVGDSAKMSAFKKKVEAEGAYRQTAQALDTGIKHPEDEDVNVPTMFRAAQFADKPLLAISNALRAIHLKPNEDRARMLQYLLFPGVGDIAAQGSKIPPLKQ
ncbi:MAG TPA: hypothetical protein VMT20_15200 [Terriglobia bacterium]|nr:hypothetical protein [Terriglobia bacterium]